MNNLKNYAVKLCKTISFMIRSLFFISLLFSTVLCSLYSCNNSNKGKEKMENNNIVVQIRELNSNDEERLEKMSEIIKNKSWKDPNDLVDLLHSGDAADFKKAAIIVLNLEELVLSPLLNSLNTQIPKNYVWDMETIIEIQMRNRKKITKVLNNMFPDKRSIEMPKLPYEEEEYIPRRVCDEAYLLMRRLLALEEDEEEQFINEDIFLNMSDEERDKEISRVKSTKKWINLTTFLLNEDEIE